MQDHDSQELIVARQALARTDGGDALSRYLAQVRAAPFLSAEEELDLARRWYDGQEPDAGQRLVAAHLRLVVKMAFQYHRQWANVMDLIQEGNLGLVEALNRFDPFRHSRFSTYARYWVRAMILRFLLDNFRMVKFSSTRAGRKLFFQLQKERERLISLGVDPSTPRLARELEVNEDEVRAVSQHLDRPALDLDGPSGPGDTARPLHEVIPDQIHSPEAATATADLRTRVGEVFAGFAETLEGREKEIWELHTVAEAPLSFSELGARFGVSKQRAAQIERGMKLRLKSLLDARFGQDLEFELA
ncbi:MAG: sigma-70 family RNA polymerase sigma factor [Proteobacteria bacterium]|nr:sigma-70 family RNA polymerase sigma factor [Pseudomonadota bacterium]MCP4920534.1 sigma-70 family RNA polymerase sigma factor [Pseudomonadota bacterium]